MPRPTVLFCFSCFQEHRVRVRGVNACDRRYREQGERGHLVRGAHHAQGGQQRDSSEFCFLVNETDSPCCPRIPKEVIGLRVVVGGGVPSVAGITYTIVAQLLRTLRSLR